MIKVQNYIKDGDNFIAIEEFEGKVPDPEYVDSAIELVINGIPIITCREWDNMDDLWSYIANGFEELIEKSEWTTEFPDQSIELTFRLDKKGKQVEVESTPSRGLVKAKTSLDEFLTAMSEGGQNFFLRMAKIVPDKQDIYLREANRISEAAKKLLESCKQKQFQ